MVRSITTGEGRTEYVPIGHSTGIAARMQALAHVRSIAATEAIRKLCEGYFLFKSLGPTKVKGVSEPVAVYEVTGLGPLRTRLQRAAVRGYTEFVGREREMETMKHAAELAKTGHGQIVAAVAEPGVGKSRLFREFKATNQFGWMVLEAFSVSHGKATVYLPVIELLQGYFRITTDDDLHTRREKVTGRLVTLDPAHEDTRPYLFGLLGLVEGADPLAQMDPQIRRRRTQDAIKRIILRESLNQPLIVVFEDLHWTLASKVARFANDNLGALSTADPEPPALDSDRAVNNLEHLLAIADLAGGDWSQRARAAAVTLSNGRDEPDDSMSVKMLADTREVLYAHPGAWIG